MVLVDTSVWIRFLYARDPYVRELDRLLAQKAAVAHELVYGELLIGDPGGQRSFLQGYHLLRQAPLAPHSEVVELVKHRHLHGRGLSWIDVHLLASALIGHHQLWSADSALADVARELGVAY